ncbi:response regulator [Pedobacter sp. HMF7647]|uniref:Response regulator n=1 Tax=Hufsiella arboris TaxID=2695275 RepID=A0A7K1Y7B0_9SPHI|nr:response regulator [Hufsiella arboris]MXV50330.1 response regulator [Hufsiella arboris]
MFKNVLIAEDHESANISVRKTLEDFGIGKTDYVFFCDDALKRLNKASKEGDPYELLITDLSFEEDGTVQHIKTGQNLIAAARKHQPGLKILVFSAENKAGVIEPLFTELGINGYVRKARRDAQELKDALEKIFSGRQHLPVHLRQAIKQKNVYQFSEFDIEIISLLAKGVLQKDIPLHLERKQIRPSGLSSVEKRLFTIREALNCAKNEQLVAACKDLGII